MSEKSAQNEILEKLLENSGKKTSFDLKRFISKNPIPAGAAILGAGLILFGVVFSLRNFNFGKNQVEIIEAEESGQLGKLGDKVIVHLAGAVEKPGVYELELGARLNDLLSLAGGLSDDADRNWFAKNINLAQKVSDGVKIYIPFQGEAGGGSSGAVAGISESSGSININTASQAELESLPKIGPITAKKIIDYRTQHGSFQSVDDLSKISGISSKTVEEIRELVTVF